jgi:site-specific recombinase XerD
MLRGPVASAGWSQVELGRAATLHVRRAKNGKLLRHAFGYALANAGHDTRRIQMG